MFEFTRSWYKSYLPSLSSIDFIQWASRSASLAHKIVKAPIRVDPKSTSAYTDGKTITVPALYFSKDYHANLGYGDEANSLSAITALNGSMIHEALHIVLSECDLRKAVVGNKRAEELIEQASFQTILNLVEDLFIEHYGRFANANIFPFVEGKNELFFSPKSLDERLQQFTEAKDQTSLLNLLLARKNTKIDDDELWNDFKPFVDLLDEAKDIMLTKQERVALAVRIHDLFESEDAQQSVGFSPDGDFISENKIDATIGIAEGELATELLEQLVEAMEGQLESTANIFNQAAELAEMSPVKATESKFSSVPEVKFEHVRSTLHGSIEATADFRNFARMFKYLYEEKHTLGRPNDSGTRIVKQRLHRILTDGKVLAYHDKKTISRGKPKVVLLLDASGSMSGVLWNMTRSAAYGAFLSLQRAGISVAAYAHTSVSESYLGAHEPIVYGIAAFNMPLGRSSHPTTTSDVRGRFAGLNDIYLQENFDGYAIKYVANLFPSSPGSNVMIVFSDGRPAGGSSYGGPAALEHTKEVVNSVRKSGTSVISMSLTEGVMDSNNRIYGRYNVPAYGHLLERSLQNIIMSLIGGEKRG